ncbi:hypothetical protein AALP_AAs64941U000100, partial [Arabis alpina]
MHHRRLKNPIFLCNRISFVGFGCTSEPSYTNHDMVAHICFISNRFGMRSIKNGLRKAILDLDSILDFNFNHLLPTRR